MTLKEYLDLQTCSERRLNKIKTILNKIKKIIGKDLSKLKMIDITKFLREINNSKYTQWTKNDYKKIFKAFLKYEYKKDFLEWCENKQFQDGFKTVSKKKAFNREKINKNTLIKPEELEQLLRSVKSFKWVALITLMYESAFRPCELVNLKWKDLNFNDQKGICSVRTTSPKTKDTREVPVKDCIIHLKRWREEYEFIGRKETDWVFTNPQDRNKHLSEAGIGVMLNKLCERAKIRHLYPYMFRHSRIYFIQKRLGARIASKYAGHSLETSQIYDHLDSDDVEEAMLEKVYITEELTPEEENKLKKEIENLKLQFNKTTKASEILIKILSGESSNEEVDNQTENLIIKLAEHIKRTPEQKAMWVKNKEKLLLKK